MKIVIENIFIETPAWFAIKDIKRNDPITTKSNKKREEIAANLEILSPVHSR